MRMGGHNVFLRLVLVDLVVHFANSLSVQHVAALGLDVGWSIFEKYFPFFFLKNFSTFSTGASVATV